MRGRAGRESTGTVKAAARGQFALTNLLAIPIESRAARAGGSLDVVRERRGRRGVWFGRFHFDSSPGDLDFIWTRVVSVDSPPARLQGQGSHRQRAVRLRPLDARASLQSHRAHRGRHWHYPDFGDAQGTSLSENYSPIINRRYRLTKAHLTMARKFTAVFSKRVMMRRLSFSQPMSRSMIFRSRYASQSNSTGRSSRS